MTPPLNVLQRTVLAKNAALNYFITATLAKRIDFQATCGGVVRWSHDMVLPSMTSKLLCKNNFEKRFGQRRRG